MIKNNLPNLLRDNGINQKDLSVKTGISTNTISLIFRQKICPNAETMEKLCLALNCNIGDLFYIEKKRHELSLEIA